MGEVKMLFSKLVGNIEATFTKLLAIKEAFLSFAASSWARSHKLVVECDSICVVGWIKEPSSSPWKLMRFITSIEILKLEIEDWHIIYTPRSINDFANKLAKFGVHRFYPLVMFFFLIVGCKLYIDMYCYCFVWHFCCLCFFMK
ncbi:hypothetical protein REPUB_Repub20aG0064900 [Reevesia pubescens]